MTHFITPSAVRAAIQLAIEKNYPTDSSTCASVLHRLRLFNDYIDEGGIVRLPDGADWKQFIWDVVASSNAVYWSRTDVEHDDAMADEQ